MFSTPLICSSSGPPAQHSALGYWPATLMMRRRDLGMCAINGAGTTTEDHEHDPDHRAKIGGR
jgi:hypothetical protein